MATSQLIEYNVMSDIKAILVAGGISNVILDCEEQPEVATFVRVSCISLLDNLDTGTVPSGMRRATVIVECNSYQSDDTTGTALHTLLASVRSYIYQSTIVSVLNAATTYNTYYGMLAGEDVPDEDERYRIRSLTFDLILKPATT